MSWKQQYFKRRAREIGAEEAGAGRVYLKTEELEDGSPYGLDYIWQCLSNAWKAGRAMGKSINMLDDEANQWLSELGVKYWKAIGQAFVEARIEYRLWNNRREISRHGMVNVGSASGGSAELAHQRAEELREWYVDIVEEYADMVGATSMPDANHQVMGWQEVHGFLSRLWSLYKRGPRTTEDREHLKALVTGLTGASTERVELWVRQQEGSIEHY